MRPLRFLHSSGHQMFLAATLTYTKYYQPAYELIPGKIICASAARHLKLYKSEISVSDIL